MVAPGLPHADPSSALCSTSTCPAYGSIDAYPLAATAGATSPNPQVVVRALASMVEPVMALQQ